MAGVSSARRRIPDEAQGPRSVHDEASARYGANRSGKHHRYGYILKMMQNLHGFSQQAGSLLGSRESQETIWPSLFIVGCPS